MTTHADSIRMQLSLRPMTARQLAEIIGVSQPTISRALNEFGDNLVKIGAARSIQYAVRDTTRGLPDIPIFRINADGRIRSLGTLIPVRPEGFVMRQENGITLYSDGLPWWLYDMRPQGYLGRAYAARHGVELGLPDRLSDWTDTHVLQSLISNGFDMVGNLILGERARDHFLAAPSLEPMAEIQKAVGYPRLASEAARGEIPGSSAGGEQPKFTAHVITQSGPSHVIVKFSEVEDNSVSERWRDLLLAEHHALETLRNAGISAARTQIYDYGAHRFLEIERFDRIGNLGRRGLFSLAALDAEFAGLGSAGWPTIAQQLAISGQINQDAANGANLAWAFGSLIGNSDMHNGNLSFISEHGRPYEIAPAYDMTPMSFRPRSGGGLPDNILEANIHVSVPNETWLYAVDLARAFLARVKSETRFSERFAPCVTALELHIESASAKIERLY